MPSKRKASPSTEPVDADELKFRESADDSNEVADNGMVDPRDLTGTDPAPAEVLRATLPVENRD